MTSRPSKLELRTPTLSWMLGGIAVTLCLFGVLWFVFSGIINLDQPVSQSRIVMVSGLSWMVCATVWWHMKAPQSRLHAVFTVLLTAFAVSLAGTVISFMGLLFKGVLYDHHTLRTYSIEYPLLVVLQLILAVPSAIVMQQMVLRRARPTPDLPL